MFKFLRSRASKEPASHEVTAKFEQARALSRQGQLSEAAAMCRAVLELQAGHIDALMLSAEIAAREGDPERAIQLYSNVMRLQPKYGMAYYKRGNVSTDRPAQAALASYDLAVALDPGYADAFCNRGTVLERMNRLDEALASYDRAAVLNPGDAFAYCNRGTLLLRLGRPEEALASLDQAIVGEPG